MLNQGINTEKTLCLTFTDAAAAEIKKRIEEELNVVDCGVQIFTYHVFYCDIIDEYQEKFEVPSNCKVISDPVSKAFIKEFIEELNPTYFRTEKNDPYMFVNIYMRPIEFLLLFLPFPESSCKTGVAFSDIFSSSAGDTALLALLSIFLIIQ